jgi:hypothetical protein
VAFAVLHVLTQSSRAISRRFRLIQAIIFVLFLVVLIIISLGDAQSFFIGENSPIPDSWRVLKDKGFVKILSAAIIGISYFLPWFSDFLISRKETKELSAAVEKNIVPAIEIELDL